MTVSQQSRSEPPLHKLHRDEYAMSAEQVAQILGISRQRVDQIEREAMRKVRRMLKERFSGADFFDGLACKGEGE